MRRVLVTGATGFIGTALCRRLHGAGFDVLGAVRRPCKGATPWDLRVVGDLHADTDWGSALEGVDTVVHLAGRAHVLREDHADPLAAYRQVNRDGTLNLARQAVDAGVRRLVFTSSIGVHGNQSRVPFKETDPPAPTEPYAVSKWEAEQGLRAIAEDTALDVVIVRPPLVYGPQAPGNFGKLLRWVHSGVPLPLGAVTRNRRSLVSLGNLTDFLKTCIDHPAAANQIFLVSDGEDVSTAALLRAAGEALGRPARLVPVPPRALALAATALGREATARRLLGSLQVDLSKARDTLRWSPPHTLAEGLRACAAPLAR